MKAILIVTLPVLHLVLSPQLGLAVGTQSPLRVLQVTNACDDAVSVTAPDPSPVVNSLPPITFVLEPGQSRILQYTRAQVAVHVALVSDASVTVERTLQLRETPNADNPNVARITCRVVSGRPVLEIQFNEAPAPAPRRRRPRWSCLPQPGNVARESGVMLASTAGLAVMCLAGVLLGRRPRRRTLVAGIDGHWSMATVTAARSRWLECTLQVGLPMLLMLSLASSPVRAAGSAPPRHRDRATVSATNRCDEAVIVSLQHDGILGSLGYAIPLEPGAKWTFQVESLRGDGSSWNGTLRTKLVSDPEVSAVKTFEFRDGQVIYTDVTCRVRRGRPILSIVTVRPPVALLSQESGIALASTGGLGGLLMLLGTLFGHGARARTPQNPAVPPEANASCRGVSPRNRRQFTLGVLTLLLGLMVSRDALAAGGFAPTLFITEIRNTCDEAVSVTTTNGINQFTGLPRPPVTFVLEPGQSRFFQYTSSGVRVTATLISDPSVRVEKSLQLSKADDSRNPNVVRITCRVVNGQPLLNIDAQGPTSASRPPGGRSRR